MALAAFEYLRAPTQTPQTERFRTAVNCAKSLGSHESAFSNSSSPQSIALNWYVDGPGVDLAVTSDDGNCSSMFHSLYALIVIRESLDIRDTSWYSPLPLLALPCGWKRITCSEDYQSISRLFLAHDTGLSGTLPRELLGLSKLESLVVFSNERLRGSLPSVLGRLGNLTTLQLHDTGVGGTIPTELGHLNLQELLLHKTDMSGTLPKELCRVPHLRLPRGVEVTC